MQHTFQLNAGELDASFVKSVRALYGKKKIRIVIEEVEDIRAQPDQLELYEKALEVRERFKNAKIDPNINLSDLANEVNL